MQRYIYGAGGHGKVVWDAMQCAGLSSLGFVDDRAIGLSSGLQVHSTSDVLSKTDISIHFAIGDCKTRQKLADSLGQCKFFSVVHPKAIVAKTSEFGEGNFLAALSVVAPNAILGSHCIVNHTAVVDHDCRVADFVHIAPHAVLGGGVKVGKGVLIGSGAVILPGLEIGDYAIVGAGAIVTKNVSAGTTVVGNPAKILNKL